MAYTVELKPSVRKQLTKLEHRPRLRIAAAIDALAENPRPPGCVKLTGVEAWHIRVGAYRIISETHDDRLVVLVIRVVDRKDVYRWLWYDQQQKSPTGNHGGEKRAKGVEPSANPHISGENEHVAPGGAPKASPTLSLPMVADADLQAVIDAWPAMPAPIRAGILAMIRAAKG